MDDKVFCCSCRSLIDVPIKIAKEQKNRDHHYPFDDGEYETTGSVMECPKCNRCLTISIFTEISIDRGWRSRTATPEDVVEENKIIEREMFEKREKQGQKRLQF
jgi:hypothetical protein